MLYEEEFYNNREEWLKARKNGLGGSDAGAAIGQNKYKSRSELWAEKTGIAEPKDLSDVLAVLYGSKAEAPIREIFALDYPQMDIFHKENYLLRSKEYPFMTYSPDGLLRDKEQDKRGILEIKTTTIRSKTQVEDWDGGIPQSYYCQILHGLIVTGFDFVVLRALIRSEDIRIMKDYLFEAKSQNIQDDMDFLLKGEIEFWKHVQDKTIPPANLPKI